MPKRPRVAFAARLMPPQGGGIERYSEDVLQALHGEFDVVDLANRGPRRTQLPYLAGIGRRLAKAVREGAVVADGGDATLARPLANCGAPGVVRVHGLDLLKPNPIQQAYVRRYLPRVAIVVANSGPTAALLKRFRIPEERVRVIHPGAILQGTWTPRPEAGRILLAGRLVPRKAVAEFVRDVWPLIVRQLPQARLDIVGDGPEAMAVRAAVARAPAADHIALHGYASRQVLDDLYGRASVFAMNNRSIPGDFEGFGIVAAEAALRGVPVVARAVDGVVDAVAPERTGSLVVEGDHDAMATAIVRMAGGALRPLAIQREAQERWGFERLRRQYTRVLREAQEGAGGRPGPATS